MAMHLPNVYKDIELFIKENYKEMYLKWSKYSENGFYGSN